MIYWSTHFALSFWPFKSLPFIVVSEMYRYFFMTVVLNGSVRAKINPSPDNSDTAVFGIKKQLFCNETPLCDTHYMKASLERRKAYAITKHG